MSANTDPIFTGAPRAGVGVLAASNQARDGSGTPPSLANTSSPSSALTASAGAVISTPIAGALLNPGDVTLLNPKGMAVPATTTNYAAVSVKNYPHAPRAQIAAYQTNAAPE